MSICYHARYENIISSCRAQKTQVRLQMPLGELRVLTGHSKEVLSKVVSAEVPRGSDSANITVTLVLNTFSFVFRLQL